MAKATKTKAKTVSPLKPLPQTKLEKQLQKLSTKIADWEYTTVHDSLISDERIRRVVERIDVLNGQVEGMYQSVDQLRIHLYEVEETLEKKLDLILGKLVAHDQFCIEGFDEHGGYYDDFIPKFDEEGNRVKEDTGNPPEEGKAG